MQIFDESQSEEDFDLSTLPPLAPTFIQRRQAVADLLKEQSGSDGFHAKRAALAGDSYWLDLAGHMINHPGVSLPRV